MFYIHTRAMSNQKLKNDLTKSAWLMSANIKDVVAKNIVKAINTKEIIVPREYVHKLVYLIQASVDSAFEGSLRDFQKEIDKLMVQIQIDPSKKK